MHFADSQLGSIDTPAFQARNFSSQQIDSPEMSDFGHVTVLTGPRAQTTLSAVTCSTGRKPQRRTTSRLFLRHGSHFQASGSEAWKWKATISFFFLPPRGRSRV